MGGLAPPPCRPASRPRGCSALALAALRHGLSSPGGPIPTGSRTSGSQSSPSPPPTWPSPADAYGHDTPQHSPGSGAGTFASALLTTPGGPRPRGGCGVLGWCLPPVLRRLLVSHVEPGLDAVPDVTDAGARLLHEPVSRRAVIQPDRNPPLDCPREVGGAAGFPRRQSPFHYQLRGGLRFLRGQWLWEAYQVHLAWFRRSPRVMPGVPWIPSPWPRAAIWGGLRLPRV